MTISEPNFKNLDNLTARKIIEIVGNHGTPPEYGFQFFTVGLDPYLNVIESEYLKDFVKKGGSVFKLVVGTYGGGKTHFLYSVREISWKYNYISSYVALSPQKSPFHKLEEVYKAIVENLIYSQSPESLLSRYDRGIEAVIKKWYYEKHEELSSKYSGEDLTREINSYLSQGIGPYESLSFKNAVKEAFLSLYKEKNEDFSLIMQWIKGENPYKSDLKEFKIYEKLDKSTAFKMIRSLVQWLTEIGYSGVVVLLDEGEPSKLSSKQREIVSINMREIIDECGQINFQNTMWFYAVPDENFLEGKTLVYEALRQRLATVFGNGRNINPTGVKIYLEKLSQTPEETLEGIGHKLSKIFEVAYGIKLNEVNLDSTIKNIAQDCIKRKFDISYKRRFVQMSIAAFQILKNSDRPLTAEDINM